MTPRRTSLLILATAAVVLLAAASGCERAPGVNVLLVTIDTLRDDHCSISGYARPTTPQLEALAREGTRVEWAYAPTATTGPTHASIFTALYPLAHGVVKNGMTLEESFGTLAETLRDRGYDTAAVVSSFVLDARFGYSQGFEAWDDDFDPQSATITRERLEGHTIEGAFDRRADTTTARARLALERLARARRPFFLFVHYFDPHFPYVPPEEWARPFAGPARDELSAAIDAYDGEIAFADDEIGKLLRAVDEAGLAGDTLVVITADHGEGLMQHGHMTHGVQLYEEAVRVPLLFRLPGRIAAGRTLAGPVELVDLLPTVLDLTGHEIAFGLHGQSLADALVGRGTLDPERPIWLHRRHYPRGEIAGIPVAGEKFGVRIGSWKYIEGDEEGTRELFDLATDPGERVDVHQTQAEVAERMRARLAAWRSSRERGAVPEALPPDVRERLGALGYVE